MYSKRYNEMTQTEYYKQATLACHQMIDALEIDDAYKVPLSDYDDPIV